MTRRRRWTTLLAVLAALILGACSNRQPADDSRATVVASFFPLAEAARVVSSDAVIINLTPPGVEPHDLELTAKQVDQIEDADLVVYVADGFQPAIEQAAKRAKKTIAIEGDGGDPHVWLDPVTFKSVVERIAAGIPGANATAFAAELDALDRDYAAGLATCARRVLVTAHDAFGRLAARYRLETHALSGLSPEAEPNPERVAELADLVKRTGTTTVFTETLVSPKVAQALAREAGVQTQMLDPLESGEAGTYLSAMRANLAKLRTALGCT